MKTLGLLGFMIAAGALIPATRLISPEDNKSKSDVGSTGFALVELFTSEGCSSCPPADAHLADIVENARRNDQRVYALAFHVDYWDYIGWKDPYASKQFSDRQRAYAEAFGSPRIYTPQMIVNGQHEFVGSSRSEAKHHITRSLEQPATLSLLIQKKASSGRGKVALDYEISSLPSGAVLHVAVVESGLVTQIKRGENSGRTLKHENVVRIFETFEPDAKLTGEVVLQIPEIMRLEK